MPSSSFSLRRPSASTSTSSVSSPSASSVSARKQDTGGCCEQSPRRLTRQKKLRHINDQDLCFPLPEKSRSSPTSPEYSTRKSTSPDRESKSNHWSSSAAAAPQPLPLPESPVIGRPGSVPKDGYFGHALCRKKRNQVATTSAPQISNSINNQGAFSSAPQNSNSSNRQGPSSSAPLTNSSNRRRALSSQDVNNNGGGFNYNLGLNVFSRKAQANVFSSHPLSPQRSNFVEMDGFPVHVATTSPINCSSNYHRGKRQEDESYNFSKSAPTSGFSSPAVSPRRSKAGEPNNIAHSPSHSALPSPTSRSPRFNHKNSNGNVFALHHKSFTEGFSERGESSSQVNAHPLPLPPGAVVLPQPSSMHHNAELLSTSSMNGQWQKGKLIGRGTFGSVYLATNRETGALCAMKEVDLIPDDPKSAECIKQLEQEIKVLRALKHPNIVQYYGSEVIDDHFYIYLEYVHPGSINKYVQDHIGAMTESVVRNFTRHILSGLAFLHNTKTIHRDIKGANLLVDASGVVKLADFGMAKHLNGHSYNLSLKGSPYWMAPEVIKAVMQNNADPDLALAVDIWSLGCTIIEMFNGKPPWSDFTGPQAMFKVLNTIPDIPETLSAEGKDFLSWCFRRNPAERPSAIQLLEHPFVRNPHDQTVSHYAQNFSLMNLIDKLHSPRDHTKPKNGRC
ncbi:mitogen-activated protein kinase kinase kinase 5-like [Prunus avium]|uniref:mitogen-activated protein kinase kinase kinase n=1 Tax=Prunus avium TaxID=42229 RepID=A0A6P5SX95_PRUAV|nr:mitogen-activated protein kinase kinase kinase 5-like [Prunus avium]